MDYVLKDSSRPAILQNKVNFELMGKNEWRHVSSIDAMHNDSLILFLDSTLIPEKEKLIFICEPIKNLLL